MEFFLLGLLFVLCGLGIYVLSKVDISYGFDTPPTESQYRNVIKDAERKE